LLGLSFLVLPAFAEGPKANSADAAPHWWRGNMHTHTFWSDGDDFPETVGKWYKDHGYQFVVYTDHNVLLKGERWKRMPEKHQALEKYRNLFGGRSVQTRLDESLQMQIRLGPLSDFRAEFEEPQRFLMIMGSEITDKHGVHLLAFDLDKRISPVGGSAAERGNMLKENVRRISEYRDHKGRHRFAVLAHPNYKWAITAEMMAPIADLRFFEVYNSSPGVRNDGDAHRASTDRIWDIVLALRLGAKKGKLLYGLATDDAHNYHGGGAGPGRGWVMVRSQRLEPEMILDAMDRGDFYSTTGVILRDIRLQGNIIRVQIEPRDGVKYLTEYVGTRRGFDPSSKPTLDASGKEISNTTRTYSRQIGEVFARSEDISSSYKFSGDELYVRVRITSTVDRVDGVTGKPLGGKQRAWGQPMILKPR
jgi:hypothetical protein